MSDTSFKVTTPSPEKVHLEPHDLNVSSSLSRARPKHSLSAEDSGIGSHNKPVQLSKQRGSTLLNRSGSLRSKGLTLNLAVSPVGTGQQNPELARHRSLSNSSSMSGSLPQATQSLSRSSSVSNSPNPNAHGFGSKQEQESVPEAVVGLKYDVPLPPTSELMSLDFEAKLRLLALKEMSVVEIKDSINSLQKRLANHDKELHKLREIIQKSLYNDLNQHRESHTTRQRQDSNPREEAIAHSRRRNDTGDDKSSIWSNLSKPLNLIQQFDTMLQNEFEKSLINHVPPNKQQQQSAAQTQLRKHKSRLSEDSNSSTSSMPSPLKSKSTKADNINLDDLIQEERPEDMIHTVSNSIWSFVNEVKTNVLSTIQDSENTADDSKTTETGNYNDDTIYNIDNGSNISLSENTVINEQEFDKLLDLKDKQD